MSDKNTFKAIFAFHPGVTLKEKLAEMDMSVKEFALRTTKPEKTINAVLSGESSLTPDMSIAFEQITMIPAHFWLDLQRNYDEYQARLRKEEVWQDAETVEWAGRFPYAIMARLGWVDATRKISEKIENLFSFFKVTSVKAWNDYFIDQQLKSAFRISLAGTSDPYAISAWLRRGEILAAEMETKQPYSEANLKEKIPLMLALVEEQPADFAAKLRNLCSEAGVKIIYMHHIPHAPVNGCIRWIDDVPCVQLTDKQKRNDVFWFSFFHELGHILLHGKKDVFLEDTRYSSMMQEKEYEADCFASEKLLSSKLEEALIRELSTHKPTVAYLEAKAREYRTHPAILVGRLQHKGLLRQDSSLNGLKVTISVDGSDITTPDYDRK